MPHGVLALLGMFPLVFGAIHHMLKVMIIHSVHHHSWHHNTSVHIPGRIKGPVKRRSM